MRHMATRGKKSWWRQGKRESDNNYINRMLCIWILEAAALGAFIGWALSTWVIV